ncbi:hypothetical protein [Hydrogenimonas sp.]
MRDFFLFFLLFLLMGGCSQKSSTTYPDISGKRSLPVWYTRLPEGRDFYGRGMAETMERAVERAESELRDDREEKLLRSFEKRWKRFEAYLDEKERKRIEKDLLRLKIFRYEISKKEKLPDGRCVVLLGVKRSVLAEPFKKKVLHELVSIEESWHAVRDSDLLTRYRTARRSGAAMIGLLPDYVFASSIDPFPKSVEKRMEEGVSYFSGMERSLRNRLRFCIEPAETPALRLFSEAVENVLKRGRYPLVDWGKAKEDTICILVEGKLRHERDTDFHLLRASIDLKLREPYRDVIEKRHYVVKGVSASSGLGALHQAKRALERRLAVDFPLSEWRGTSPR